MSVVTKRVNGVEKGDKLKQSPAEMLSADSARESRRASEADRTSLCF